jgi:hypothetical protein
VQHIWIGQYHIGRANLRCELNAGAFALYRVSVADSTADGQVRAIASQG